MILISRDMGLVCSMRWTCTVLDALGLNIGLVLLGSRIVLGLVMMRP